MNRIIFAIVLDSDRDILSLTEAISEITKEKLAVHKPGSGGLYSFDQQELPVHVFVAWSSLDAQNIRNCISGTTGDTIYIILDLNYPLKTKLYGVPFLDHPPMAHGQTDLYLFLNIKPKSAVLIIPEQDYHTGKYSRGRFILDGIRTEYFFKEMFSQLDWEKLIQDVLV